MRTYNYAYNSESIVVAWLCDQKTGLFNEWLNDRVAVEKQGDTIDAMQGASRVYFSHGRTFFFFASAIYTLLHVSDRRL